MKFITRAVVSVDALRLNEDIRALERAQRELKTVDRYNVDDNPDSDLLWMCIQRIKTCQRYAENKLRKEFLDPRRKQMNARERRAV